MIFVMRTPVIALCGFLAACHLIPAAEACRVMRSPEQRIADAYASNPKLKIAVVRVTDARHFSSDTIREAQARLPDFEPPWRATAAVVRMIVGDVSPELIMFDRQWTSCTVSTPKPRAGEDWVVYYNSDAPFGLPEVVESHSLADALRADPRLPKDDG